MHSHPKNVKKMCSTEKNKTPLLSFTYPKLHIGKDVYVDFFAFDPAEGKMKRKKYMLNSNLSAREKKRRATEIMEAAISKLRIGWNPWINENDSRSYTLFEDVVKRYITTVNKSLKEKTKKDYNSRIKVMLDYNARRINPLRYIYQYDEAFVSDFLDWVYLDRESSARTRNNYRGWCFTFATYLKQKRYIKVNPVESIPLVKEQAKFRQPLIDKDLNRLSRYLNEHNKFYLLACQFEYYTFIRPDELSNIKVGDINLHSQKIFIRGEIAKNGRNSNIGLNDILARRLIELRIFDNPSSYYLFGYNFMPNEKKADSRIFREQWNRVRAHLNFPSHYQFYSLKDSGIRDLANSVGIVIARDQARHTEISTTNKYLQGRNQPVHEETKHFDGAL